MHGCPTFLETKQPAPLQTLLLSRLHLIAILDTIQTVGFELLLSGKNASLKTRIRTIPSDLHSKTANPDCLHYF